MSYSFEENLNCSIFMLTNNGLDIGLSLDHNTYIKNLTNFTHLNGPAYFTQNDIIFDDINQYYLLPSGYNYFIEINLVQGFNSQYLNNFDPLNGKLPYVYDQNVNTIFSQTAFVIENESGQQISNIASSTFLYENSNALNSAICFIKSPNNKFKIKHLGNSYTLLDKDNSNPSYHSEINEKKLISRILIKAYPNKSTSNYIASSWLNTENIKNNISWILANNTTLTTSIDFQKYFQNYINKLIDPASDENIKLQVNGANVFFNYLSYGSNYGYTWYQNSIHHLNSFLYSAENSLKNLKSTITSEQYKTTAFLKQISSQTEIFNPYPCYLEINFKKNKVRWGIFHNQTVINNTTDFPQIQWIVKPLQDIVTTNNIKNELYESGESPYNKCYIIDLMSFKYSWVFTHPITINIVLPDNLDNSSYKSLNNNSPIFNDANSIISPQKGDKICFVFKYFDKKILFGDSIKKQHSLYSDFGPNRHFISSITKFDNSLYEPLNHMNYTIINKKVCLFISNTSIHESIGNKLLLSTSNEYIPSYFYSTDFLLEYLNERNSINLEWNGYTWTNQKEIVFPENVMRKGDLILPNFTKNLKFPSNYNNNSNLSYSSYTRLGNANTLVNINSNKIIRQGKYTYVMIDNSIDYSWKTNFTDKDDLLTCTIDYIIDNNYQVDDYIIFNFIREVKNSKPFLAPTITKTINLTGDTKNLSPTNIYDVKTRVRIKNNNTYDAFYLTDINPVSVDSDRKKYIFRYDGSNWEVLDNNEIILSAKQSDIILLDNNTILDSQITIPLNYNINKFIRLNYTLSTNNKEYYLPDTSLNIEAGTKLIIEYDNNNTSGGSFIIKDKQFGNNLSDIVSIISNRKKYIFQYDGISWVDIGSDYVIINELPTSHHLLYNDYNTNKLYPSFTNLSPISVINYPAGSNQTIYATSFPNKTSNLWLNFPSTLNANITYILPYLEYSPTKSYDAGGSGIYFNSILFTFQSGGLGSLIIKAHPGNGGQQLFDTINNASNVKSVALEWNGEKWCVLNELKDGLLQNY